MKRFLSALLAFALLFQGADAFTPRQRVILGTPNASWIQQGNPGIDFYFARAGRSCAVNKVLSNCAAVINNTRNNGANCLWSNGTWVAVGASVSCLTDLGLWVWEGTTNQALRSRDMTQAAWTASNITTALNATGIDGAANAATTLTASAGNGTILQSITLGSAANTYSFFIERKTGSGEIDITQNNGGTWTSLTSANCINPVTQAGAGLSSTAFVRCFVESTLANPVVGVRIVTNGDAVIVDGNQDEGLAYMTPPVFTTSATGNRSQDAISINSNIVPAAFTAFPQTMFASGTILGPLAITRVAVDWGDGTSNNRAEIRVSSANAVTLLTTAGGSSIATVAAAGTITSGQVVKMAAVAASADYAMVWNNGTVATASTAGAMPTVSSIQIGRDSGNVWDGLITRVTGWPAQRETNTFIQSITQ